MSEYNSDTKPLLTELLANQQSLHDALAVLSERLGVIESTLQELLDTEGDDSESWLGNDADPLYPYARQLVVELGRVSTSLLQRVMRIGYARAASLVDTLEANGVVSSHDSLPPRAVLLTREELDTLGIIDNAQYQFSTTIEPGDQELYEAAKQAVITAGTASASNLQRTLRISYSRAMRLLDMLEAGGVIGPADGVKPRKVLE